MPEFTLYQSYAAQEAAEPLLELLRQRNIPFETSIDTGHLVFDPSFANNGSFAQFMVKVHPGDIEWVRRLEEEARHDLLAQADPEHYLFKFSDEELMDILTKTDEWNSYDVTLAGQLLRQRGRDVSADTMRLLRQHRLQEQAKPEESQRIWILFGYISSLLGGLLAMFIGAHLHWHRKTLSNGQRPYAFSAQDRRHGLRIFVLGITMFIILSTLRIVYR